jgi:hypothetical protein
MAVRLFTNDGFHGQPSQVFEHSISDLRSTDPSFNDKASSIVVTGHSATFFEDINFGGAKWTLAPGQYTLGEMAAHGIPNDVVSSFLT